MSNHLRILVKSHGSFDVGAGLWNNNGDTVGEIKEVHEDHIIGRLYSDDEPMRFNFVGDRFDDGDGDKSQAIEKVVEQPAQPDRLYIIEDPIDAIEKCYTGGFSSNGFIWREGADGDAVDVGRVVEVHHNYIIGRLDKTDEYVRFDFVDERFKDVDEEPSQEIVRHAAQAKEKPAQAIQVGQYAFENGKFFGTVTKGDKEHIRIDDPNDYKCWFGIHSAREQFEFHTIKPGMWLAPKTSGTHRLIERITPSKEFPMVVMQDGGSIFFADAIKDYDILTPEQHDTSSPPVKVPPLVQGAGVVNADEWNGILKPASPKFGQYVFKDGKCLGKVTDRGEADHPWFVDHTDTIRPVVCAHEFVTIEPGMVIDHKIIVIQPAYTIGMISLGNGYVEPHLVTTSNHLINLSDFAANWTVVDSSKPTQSQPLEIGTTFKFRTLPDRWAPFNPQNCLDNTFTVIEHEDRFKGEGQCVTRNDLSGVIFSVLFGVLASDDIEILPAQQVFDEYGLPLAVGYDVFYKVSGELCGKITELHEDNQITMEFMSGVTDDTVIKHANIVPCYNPRVDTAQGQPWGFCPHNWGYTNEQRIMRIDRFERLEKAEPAPNGRTAAQANRHFKPVEGTMFVNVEDGVPIDKWKRDLWIRETRIGAVPGEYVCGHIKEWCDNHVIALLDGKDELNKFYFTKNTFLDDNEDPSVEVVKSAVPIESVQPNEPAAAPTDWVVDDEFEIQIKVGDVIFLKKTGEVIGHVDRLRDDNQLDIKFGPPHPEFGSALKCYNPRSHTGEQQYGFHRSRQFTIDLARVDYIHELEEKPAQPQPDPTLAKLEECDVTDTDNWLSRNRPPVDLHNGDTIVTVNGVYRLHDNKWVKVAGNLRVRSHDHLPNSEAVNVERIEHKFISDTLPDTVSDPCTEKIYMPIHGNHVHLNDVQHTARPKGKPLNMNEIIRKQLNDEAWASILKGNAENSQRSED